MNEKLYKANVQLVDDNRVLKEDKKILQRRIDKAIEQLEKLSVLYNDNYTVSDKAKEIIDLLKGEKIDGLD